MYRSLFLDLDTSWRRASRPGRFTPGDIAPNIYWIWGWLGSRAGLDHMGKWELLTLAGLELQPLLTSEFLDFVHRPKF
jgi:hypothetical protein